MKYQLIRRALLSVSDKTKIIDLAEVLLQYNCELISTGGTAKALSAAGLPYTDISLITGNPEAFGGRMKTISFAVGSALLFDRERDEQEARSLQILPIDLVVCNLYPFKKVWEAGADVDTLIENIDIGGPTMVRAAAKNFKYVGVLTNPDDYAAVIAEMNANRGAISYQTRRELMRKAFNHTADYDAMIAVAMDGVCDQLSYRLAFDEGRPLRYGENAHQNAHFYRQRNLADGQSLFDLEVLHGKALSFNNIMDIQAAGGAVRLLGRQGCAVVKHNNPCGFSECDKQAAALEQAWAGDPISAFGSVIAFNNRVELDSVSFFRLDNPNKQQRKFVEVVLAPDFSPEALAYLQQHKDLRVIRANSAAWLQTEDLRYMGGALLRQDSDTALFENLTCVTQTPFDTSQWTVLIGFGLKAIMQIKSNSIVVVRQKEGNLQLLGMGAGQPNRLIATKLALEKCIENITTEAAALEVVDVAGYIKIVLGEAILVSDAFFPFEDNVELAAEYGIRRIVQPGGSIRDKHVIAKCNELGVSMVFSGIRHFKH